MAKNYTIKEAVEIIAKGTDLEAIAELGKRFPVLTTKIAVVAAKAGSDFVDFMSYMPEHLTANKVNTVIKNGYSATESDVEEDDVAEETDAPTPKKEKVKVEAADVNVTWNEDMSGKELVKVLRKAGKGSLITSKKKADLIELCKKTFGAAEAVETAEDADVDVEETEANPYEGMTAMELFKECKKRGLKVESKKKAKFYIDLLTKDDAKTVEPAAEDDDWEDEDEAEEAPAPAPVKETKKASKKAEKKAAKKVEEAEDDDDDWDI